MSNRSMSERVAEPPPRVGVLSLQGDFACHRAVLESLGTEPVRVTRPAHLDGLQALILPGGESTTMLRLLHANGLREPVERWVSSRPTLGTCAGVILLGRGGDRLPSPPFRVLDAEVSRNAYGRQIDSFSETLQCPPLGGEFHGVFIRAPRIGRIGSGVEVVARRTDPAASGEIVGVRQGVLVGLCFHPELTEDRRFHRWFLEDVADLQLTIPASAEPASAEEPA